MDSADVPIVEIATPTLHAEARAAVAVVAGLHDLGVPVRDIVIVARSLERYEEPLTRAAIQYGIPPVYWTQIDLVRTRPYQLILALCDLFATSRPNREVLFRPLELGWAPRNSTGEWPIESDTLVTTYSQVPKTSRSMAAWQSLLGAAARVDSRIVEFVEWAGTQPEPTPDAVAAILGSAITSYREQVLPRQQAADSPALLETELAARAVVQMEKHIEQVESKYAHRLAEGMTEPSWASVAGICESLARQRPGRREHANALALDILEANDVWAREIPFIVAVGLVDGEWPQQPRSVVPAELRQAILRGSGPTQQLSPRTAWIGGRDYDQFLDTVRAATTGLIVTRHTHDVDGVRQYRSPLLDHFDATTITQSARRRLLSQDRVLPDSIRAMLIGQNRGTTGESADE